MTVGAAREEMVAFLRRHLVGPAGGPDEVLDSENRPHERYTVGVLYPPGTPFATTAETTQETASTGPAGGAPDNQLADDPISTALDDKPSSVGVSFYLERGEEIEIQVWAATYEEQPDRSWRRVPLATAEEPETRVLTPTSTRVAVFVGRAETWSRWRRLRRVVGDRRARQHD